MTDKQKNLKYRSFNLIMEAFELLKHGDCDEGSLDIVEIAEVRPQSDDMGDARHFFEILDRELRTRTNLQEVCSVPFTGNPKPDYPRDDDEF